MVDKIYEGLVIRVRVKIVTKTLRKAVKDAN